jgi:hypothetical protein
VFLWAAGTPGKFADLPEPEPIQFGYDGRPDALKARLAELEANETPYKPDEPQPGERGYGTPKVTVKVEGGSEYNGPTHPTYRCWTYSLALPDGWWFDSDYPCQSEYSARRSQEYW